ncbi:glycoside hydrolase family 27 protein [Massilia rubra]|uniref:Alpha-galactosidase n=1 Tax=Massilia rubra TaxID=2607910 RepID=A0ABX0LJH5_9BURK|nr:glycoside hydrolase family 27 protein [Massilia rubra]NHZ32935.1 glycoside hydrolase family 27 protein [Massilia rubra]
MTTTFLRSARRFAFAFLAPLVLAMPVAAKPVSNGLARTPPMGWSSWNNFGDSIDEKLIVETIDAMVANGMRDAGYQYVNLDDGWQRYKGKRRDRPLEVDPVRFPRGIKYLADYAHSKGLKFGIYSGPGQTTCAGYTGSEGHEAQDAALFASWGVDHLKYDSCCSHKDAPVPVLKTIFGTMSTALMAQRRGIVLHACHCGWGQPWEWAADMGINHWRIGQDISDDFDYPGNREKYYFDVLDTLDRGVGLEKHAGPGHWNDYDMLIVGLNGRSKELVGAGASNVEYRTHFSLWAMVNSPLLAGADLRSLDVETLATFTNKEIIALNQDPLGKPAEKVRDDGVLQIYAKELADGSYAVALLNRGSATADMTLSLRRDLALTWKKYRVRDLWRHQDVGTYDIPFTTEVISHEARVLRLTPVAD